MNIRRKIKRFERMHNLHLKHDLFVASLGMFAAMFVYTGVYANTVPPISPCPTAGCQQVPSPTVTPTLTPTVTPTMAPKATKPLRTGNASYYSIDGCLGCNPERIMANGEKLDDGRLTLAYNHLPMNTVVTIRNTQTGATVRATVTDTGGFERHGKIADLSVATRDALGCGSLCPIAIEL